ncbi:MAG: hypothetical protein ACE5DI_00590 [Candidatus Micrarchaeia archaeon]
MFKRIVFCFLALTVLSGFVFAAQVVVTDPRPGVVYALDVVDLGNVGPGQQVSISIDRETGEESLIDSSQGGVWDQLNVLENSLLPGWRGKNAKIYSKEPTAFVFVSKDAPSDSYEFELQAVDEYQGASPLTFSGKVFVTPDVLEFSVAEREVVAGVGSPAVYTLVVENTGSANDAFEVSVTGLPLAWNYSKTVYLQHHSKKTIRFEVGAKEPGNFDLVFAATSKSSDKIKRTAKTRLVSKASLLQELRATGFGIGLFPSVEQPVLALLGFLANVFG